MNDKPICQYGPSASSGNHSVAAVPSDECPSPAVQHVERLQDERHVTSWGTGWPGAEG